MNISETAKFVDLLALSFVFGATAWFFFIQSPVLLRCMGREAFVPVQMQLAVVLFRTLTVLLVVLLGASTVHRSLDSTAVLTAGVALLGGLINKFVVLPRALKAGGRTHRSIKGKDDQSSATGFASEGAGDGTRILHRLVVVFVVVMLGGVVGHGLALLEII